MSLSVSGIVRVTVNLNPLAAAVRAFGSLMVAGDSNVINGLERYRTYLSYEGVLADFSVSDPEALAAQLYYEQTPQPSTLLIGRWLRTATAAINLGGLLTTAQQALANWTVINNGGMVIIIDGVTKTLTGLDFSAQTNLNGVATVITTALGGAGTCTWTGSYFKIVSATTGVSSSVGYATTGSGTSISAQLKMTSALSQSLVPGYAAESPAVCAAALALISTAWYGLMFSASVQPTDNQSIAVSDVIEALEISRIYGVTTTDSNVLSAAVTSDLASLMQDGGYLQSFVQYCSTKAYAVASFFGRAFTVDFTAQNTTITLMFKQEPGVTAEDLNQNQATVLEDKRCNVFVSYVNDTTIIQHGVMSGDAYFDEIHGTDWLQNAIQTACYNVLYLSGKVPQTDAGVNQLVNAIAGVSGQAVLNGLVAPGTWTGPSFGTLKSGDFLKSGYYIYAQPVALQSQSDRDARMSPPIQVAIKLAGAIQSVDIIVDVNR